MKKLLILSMLCVALFSCQKSSNSPDILLSGNKSATYTYQVLCSSGNWSGTYLADNGTWVQVSNQSSGWTYTGNPNYYPTFLTEIVTMPQTDAAGITFTINITVNGTKVRTVTYTTDGQYADDQNTISYDIQ